MATWINVPIPRDFAFVYVSGTREPIDNRALRADFNAGLLGLRHRVLRPPDGRFAAVLRPFCGRFAAALRPFYGRITALLLTCYGRIRPPALRAGGLLTSRNVYFTTVVSNALKT